MPLGFRLLAVPTANCRARGTSMVSQLRAPRPAEMLKQPSRWKSDTDCDQVLDLQLHHDDLFKAIGCSNETDILSCLRALTLQNFRKSHQP